MKTLATIVAAGILFFSHTDSSLAQVPRTISYQGILTDSTGIPKMDDDYNFVFRFYKSASGGTAIWVESKTLPVTRGLFSTMLGDVSPFPDSVSFHEAYWLGVQVEGTELLPRIRLGAVGYALRAINADTATFVLNAAAVQRPLTPGISESELQDSSVTETKIASGALRSFHVAPDFMSPKADTANIALWADTATVALTALTSSPTGSAGGDLTGDFPNPTIVADAVTSAKIADSTITGADIAGGTITGAHIADGTLSGVDILDGSITQADLVSGFTVSRSDTAAVAESILTTADVTVSSISGDGGGLENLDASNLAQGTVPSGRIAGEYSGEVQFTNGLNQFTGIFSGDGSGLTGVVTTGTAGGDLTGTFPNPVIADSAITTPKIADSAVTDLKILSLSASKLTGSLPAIDGSNLTSLDAGALSTGVLSSGRLSGIYSNALTLSSISNSFTGSGSGLTNLNASALSTGTVPNGRLSGSYSNQVILSNNENSFTGQYFDMTSIALGVILIKDLTEYEIIPGESTVFLIDANPAPVTITLPSTLELPRGTVYYFKLVGVFDGGAAIVPQEGEFIDLDGVGYELDILKTYVKLLSFDGAWYVLGGDGQLIIPG